MTTKEELIERKHALEKLFECSGWKLYREELEEKVREAKVKLFQPSAGVDGLISREHMGGVVYGLTVALEFADQLHDEAVGTLGLFKLEEEGVE